MSALRSNYFPPSNRRRCVKGRPSYIEPSDLLLSTAENQDQNSDNFSQNGDDSFMDPIEPDDGEEEPITIDLSAFLNENPLLAQSAFESSAENNAAPAESSSQFRVTDCEVKPSDVPKIDITDTPVSVNVSGGSAADNGIVVSENIVPPLSGALTTINDSAKENCLSPEKILMTVNNSAPIQNITLNGKKSPIKKFSRARPLGLSNPLKKYKNFMKIKDLNKTNEKIFEKYPVVKCEKLDIENFVKNNKIKVSNWPLFHTESQKNNNIKKKLNLAKSPLKPKFMKKPINLNKYLINSNKSSTKNSVNNVLGDPISKPIIIKTDSWKPGVANASSCVPTFFRNFIKSPTHTSKNVVCDLLKLSDQTVKSNVISSPEKEAEKRNNNLITNVNKIFSSAKNYQLIAPKPPVHPTGLTAPVLNKPAIETLINPIPEDFTVIEPYVEDPSSPQKPKPYLTVPVEVIASPEKQNTTVHSNIIVNVNNSEKSDKTIKTGKSVFLNGAVKHINIPTRIKKDTSIVKKDDIKKKINGENLLVKVDAKVPVKENDVPSEENSGILKAKNVVVDAMQSVVSSIQKKKKVKPRLLKKDPFNLVCEDLLFGTTAYSSILNDNILHGFTENDFEDISIFEDSFSSTSHDISTPPRESSPHKVDAHVENSVQTFKSIRKARKRKKYKKKKSTKHSQDTSDTLSASECENEDSSEDKISLKRRKISSPKNILENFIPPFEVCKKDEKLGTAIDVSVSSLKSEDFDNSNNKVFDSKHVDSSLSFSSLENHVIAEFSGNVNDNFVSAEIDKQPEIPNTPPNETLINNVEHSPSNKKHKECDNPMKQETCTRTLRERKCSSTEVDKFSNNSIKQSPHNRNSLDKIKVKGSINSKLKIQLKTPRSTSKVKIKRSKPEDIIQEINTITGGHTVLRRGLNKYKNSKKDTKDSDISNIKNDSESNSSSMSFLSRQSSRSFSKRRKTFKVSIKRSKKRKNASCVKMSLSSLTDVIENENSTSSISENNVNLHSSFREGKGEKMRTPQKEEKSTENSTSISDCNMEVETEEVCIHDEHLPANAQDSMVTSETSLLEDSSSIMNSDVNNSVSDLSLLAESQDSENKLPNDSVNEVFNEPCKKEIFSHPNNTDISENLHNNVESCESILNVNSSVAADTSNLSLENSKDSVTSMKSIAVQDVPETNISVQMYDSDKVVDSNVHDDRDTQPITEEDKVEIKNTSENNFSKNSETSKTKEEILNFEDHLILEKSFSVSGDIIGKKETNDVSSIISMDSPVVMPQIVEREGHLQLPLETIEKPAKEHTNKETIVEENTNDSSVHENSLLAVESQDIFDMSSGCSNEDQEDAGTPFTEIPKTTLHHVEEMKKDFHDSNSMVSDNFQDDVYHELSDIYENFAEISEKSSSECVTKNEAIIEETGKNSNSALDIKRDVYEKINEVLMEVDALVPCSETDSEQNCPLLEKDVIVENEKSSRIIKSKKCPKLKISFKKPDGDLSDGLKNWFVSESKEAEEPESSFTDKESSKSIDSSIKSSKDTCDLGMKSDSDLSFKAEDNRSVSVCTEDQELVKSNDVTISSLTVRDSLLRDYNDMSHEKLSVSKISSLFSDDISAGSVSQEVDDISLLQHKNSLIDNYKNPERSTKISNPISDKNVFAPADEINQNKLSSNKSENSCSEEKLPFGNDKTLCKDKSVEEIDKSLSGETSLASVNETSSKNTSLEKSDNSYSNENENLINSDHETSSKDMSEKEENTVFDSSVTIKEEPMDYEENDAILEKSDIPISEKLTIKTEPVEVTRKTRGRPRKSLDADKFLDDIKVNEIALKGQKTDYTVTLKRQNSKVEEITPKRQGTKISTTPHSSGRKKKVSPMSTSTPISRKKNFDPELVCVPFGMGWMREHVIRATGKEDKRQSDIYYFAPDGMKLRSMPEIIAYISKHPSINLSAVNFTFAKELIFREPFEIERDAKQGVRKVSTSTKKSPVKTSIKTEISLVENSPTSTVSSRDCSKKARKSSSSNSKSLEQKSITSYLNNKNEKTENKTSRPSRKLVKKVPFDNSIENKHSKKPKSDKIVHQKSSGSEKVSVKKATVNKESLVIKLSVKPASQSVTKENEQQLEPPNSKSSVTKDNELPINKSPTVNNTENISNEVFHSRTNIKSPVVKNRLKVKLAPRKPEFVLRKPCTKFCDFAHIQEPTIACCLCLCLFHPECIPFKPTGLTRYACLPCVNAQIDARSNPSDTTEEDIVFPANFNLKELYPEVVLDISEANSTFNKLYPPVGNFHVRPCENSSVRYVQPIHNIYTAKNVTFVPNTPNCNIMGKRMLNPVGQTTPARNVWCPPPIMFGKTYQISLPAAAGNSNVNNQNVFGTNPGSLPLLQNFSNSYFAQNQTVGNTLVNFQNAHYQMISSDKSSGQTKRFLIVQKLPTNQHREILPKYTIQNVSPSIRNTSVLQTMLQADNKHSVDSSSKDLSNKKLDDTVKLKYTDHDNVSPSSTDTACETVSNDSLMQVSNSIQSEFKSNKKNIDSSSEKIAKKQKSHHLLDTDSGASSSSCKNVVHTVNSSENLSSCWNMNKFAQIYECLNFIFKFLNVCDLLRASLVCKSWQHLASQKLLWESVSFSGTTIKDWNRCCKILQKYGTKYIDFRGLHNQNSSDEWTSFSKNVNLLNEAEELIFEKVPPFVISKIADSLPLLKKLTCYCVTSVFSEPEIWSTPCNFELDTLRYLGRLETLKLSSMGGIYLKDNQRSLMPYLPKLTHVVLTGFKFNSYMNLECLSQQQQLITLELGDCVDIEPQIYGLLAKLTSLENLCLQNGGDINDEKLCEALSKMSKLKNLELMNFQVSCHLPNVLKRMETLHHFSLWPDCRSKAALVNFNSYNAATSCTNLKSLCWGILTDDEDTVPNTLELRDCSKNYSKVKKLTFEELFQSLVKHYPGVKVEVKCLPRSIWSEFCSSRNIM